MLHTNNHDTQFDNTQFDNAQFNNEQFDSENQVDCGTDYDTNDETMELTQSEIALLHSEMAEASEHLTTIGDFIRFSVSKLRQYDVVVAQGTTDTFAEAAAIVLHTVSLDWSADPEILPCKLVPSEKEAVLTLLSERIIERKPLSYLINLAYFCDMPFYVDERVLIPRSPTAELITKRFYPYFDILDGTDTRKFFDNGLTAKQLAPPERILDLCTGSGCIAAAIASRFSEAAVDAVDIDSNALAVAWINVQHHGLESQINLIESDLFAKLPADNQYDLIVTNPPYVDAKAMADLPPEFLYEPELALAAGQDGLDLVHQILYHASDYLTPDGLLVCEVGDSEWALRQAYPNIQFDWLKFEHGGGGIFAMDYDELVENKEAFAKYLDLSGT